MNEKSLGSPRESIPFTPAAPNGFNATRMALIILGVATAIRLWDALRIGVIGDEAYYWLWSKHLALSYRDKGPLVAWVIALGTKLFGDNAFGIRIAALAFSAGTGWQLFVLARRLYDERIALWTLAISCVLPMFVVGSVLMTIDPLSVFFWAWAANVFWSALHDPKVWRWAALGFIVGMGFLAKFTNGLQLGCVALFLLWSKPHRRLFFSRQTIVMCVAFVVAILPVIIWNYQTGWLHYSALHSRSGVENSDDGETSFQIRPAELLQFLAGQLGVLSPLVAIGIAVAAIGIFLKHRQDIRVQFLLSLFLPVAGIFIFFSLNKAGKENWPAPALITGLIFTVVYWKELVERAPRWRWVVRVALILPVIMSVGIHVLEFVPLPGKYDPLRRARGWPDFAAHVQQAREQHQATLLIGSHYTQASMMTYYLPDRPTTYLAKGTYGKNQFSLWPLYDPSHTRALYVTQSMRPIPAKLKKDFPTCVVIDDFWAKHQGRDMTRFRIWLCTRP